MSHMLLPNQPQYGNVQSPSIYVEKAVTWEYKQMVRNLRQEGVPGETKMPNLVLAISGISGAGKTTLVRNVIGLLPDAVALYFDDYRPVATYPADMARWVADGKDLDAWRIPQLLEDLTALRSGRAIVLPGAETEIKPARYIVLEEPTGREREGLRDLVDYVVFLDLPLDVALARKVVEYFNYCLRETGAEELAQAVRAGVEYFAKYPVYREYYQAIIEQTRANADLVLDGARPTAELAKAVVAAVTSTV